MKNVLRRRLGAGVLVLAALVATGAGVGAAEAGTGPVAVVEYDLGDAAFTDPPDWDGVSEVRAVVHYPRHAAGKVPVVVLLHGQQVACHSADEDDRGSWPCPAGVTPYPSYRGYGYLANALARDGFAVVSISASGLNFHFGTAPERAHLINRHLELLQHHRELRNRLDFSRVGTMGHSVGGEGVMYQAADAHRGELPPGVRIRGVVALASPGPSTFFDVRVTTAPIAVVTAGCWAGAGEKYFQKDVHGFWIRVTKGNHNFYNTAWTTGPGPTDGDDTECPQTPGRPTAAQQQGLAVHYLLAFYRYTLKGDRTAVSTLTGPFAGVDTERVTV
ncbi:hypothetical protein [Actinoplanes couchii]|nr:hypothetical protein [Actinoplanes couchii]MDR6318287.1 dienelactone hydrolase [Actinoplanes couchii]